MFIHYSFRTIYTYISEYYNNNSLIIEPWYYNNNSLIIEPWYYNNNNSFITEQ